MDVRLVSAGRDTTVAVNQTISEFQAGDPLQPVRVIVTSNVAGLSLRRLLGSRVFAVAQATPSQPAGIANVSFATPFQLASELAAPALAAQGLRPLTTPVLAAAVRHVLANQPGRFGTVANHIATEGALIRAYAEITELPPKQRDMLRGSRSPRTNDLLMFVDEVESHLRDGTSSSFHDEYAVLSLAAKVAPEVLAGERFVLVGPFSQGMATINFLSSIAEVAPVGFVASLTGDRDVDGEVVAQAGRILSRTIDPVAVSLVQPTELLAVSDSDQEANVIVRKILEAAERGTPFDRMAVFVPVHDPYLRTVREHLDRAGIPSAGPNHRTLADSMVGRLLNTLLDLVDATASLPQARHYDRNAVMALVSAAPVRGPDGKAARSGAWEDISRSAGVVGGLDDWKSRLDAFVKSIDERTKRQVDEGASRGQLSAFERERAAAVALDAFVEWIGQLTSVDSLGRSWAQRSQWATNTLSALLPRVNKRLGWPEPELVAADQIERLLSRLSVLDEVEPQLTAAAFRRAIQLELDAPAGRSGAFGTGVFVAPLALAVGVDLDEVFVVGLAEGLSPRPIREDTLLDDSERQLVGGALPQRHDRNREVRQRYLHAIAAGARSTITTPLGDHRTGRSRTVSRWWVDAVRDRTSNERVTSQNWMELGGFDNLEHASFQQSLTTAVRSGVAVSAADLQLQYVHARHNLGCELDEAFVAKPLQRGLDMISHRLIGFNRFTGSLRDIAVASPLDNDAAISPSRLQSWAECPRRFFLEQMLRLGQIERPEEIVEISALDRGSLIHAILEDFIGESLPGADHAFDSPDYRWTEADRQRLHRMAEARFQEYEDLGRTGRPLLWQIQKEATRADLDAFLLADDSLRSAHRTRPHDVELPFGLNGRGRGEGRDVADAAQIQVGERTVRLRGLVDRIDWRDDGTPVVLDYKTGRATSQAEFKKDPVRGGQSLQLGVYAEAVMQHYGASSAQAYYWYISSKGNFKHAGYPWTPDHQDRFGDAVDTIVSGIENGDFPPNPGEYQSFRGDFTNCVFCAFTQLCPKDRDEELASAIEAGELVKYLALRDHDAEAVDDKTATGEQVAK